MGTLIVRNYDVFSCGEAGKCQVSWYIDKIIRKDTCYVGTKQGVEESGLKDVVSRRVLSDEVIPTMISHCWEGTSQSEIEGRT